MTDKIPTLAVVDGGDTAAEVVEIKRTRKPRVANGAPAVFDLIAAELDRQKEQWGEQNHPLCGGAVPANAHAHYVKQAYGWKAINEDRVRDGNIGWDGILLEEVFEALAEDTTEKAIEELVQVAAVAVQAILSLKRGAK